VTARTRVDVDRFQIGIEGVFRAADLSIENSGIAMWKHAANKSQGKIKHLAGSFEPFHHRRSAVM
jgi:hypothetical protein